MKLEFTPCFFLEINLISLGDTANGPTLSFFRMSLNGYNNFIKMKGLRPNSRIRFHSHAVMRCAQIITLVFNFFLTLFYSLSFSFPHCAALYLFLTLFYSLSFSFSLCVALYLFLTLFYSLSFSFSLCAALYLFLTLFYSLSFSFPHCAALYQTVQPPSTFMLSPVT